MYLEVGINRDTGNDEGSDDQQDAAEAGYEESADGVRQWHEAQNFPRRNQYF